MIGDIIYCAILWAKEEALYRRFASKLADCHMRRIVAIRKARRLSQEQD